MNIFSQQANFRSQSAFKNISKISFPYHGCRHSNEWLAINLTIANTTILSEHLKSKYKALLRAGRGSV